MNIRLSILALFFLLFFLGPKVEAATSPFGGNIPGVNCGIAGGTPPTDQCCYNPPQKQFSIDVPFVPQDAKDAVNDMQSQLSEFQQENQTACSIGSPSPEGVAISDASCKCILSVTPEPGTKEIAQMCTRYLKNGTGGAANELTTCQNCVTSGGYYSAIGCIPLNVNSLVSDFLLKTGVGFAGVISMLCIFYASFTMQTSRGNPEKIKKAQEMLTSCIMGLVLVIFSVFILRFIGVNVLSLPGFN